MNLYLVFKEGTYRHECLGVFDSRMVAMQTAMSAAITDEDDYHSYSVVPFELNTVTPKSSDIYRVWYNEPKEIFAAKKGE